MTSRNKLLLEGNSKGNLSRTTARRASFFLTYLLTYFLFFIHLLFSIIEVSTSFFFFVSWQSNVSLKSQLICLIDRIDEKLLMIQKRLLSERCSFCLREEPPSFSRWKPLSTQRYVINIIIAVSSWISSWSSVSTTRKWMKIPMKLVWQILTILCHDCYASSTPISSLNSNWRRDFLKYSLMTASHHFGESDEEVAHNDH